MDDKLKKLYSLYKSSGLIKTTDFNTFSKANSAQRKKIYDLGKSSGLIKSIDFNTFNTAFDSVPIKKKESTSKDSHFYSKALKEVGLSDIDQPKKQKASVFSPSNIKELAKSDEQKFTETQSKLKSDINRLEVEQELSDSEMASILGWSEEEIKKAKAGTPSKKVVAKAANVDPKSVDRYNDMLSSKVGISSNQLKAVNDVESNKATDLKSRVTYYNNVDTQERLKNKGYDIDINGDINDEKTKSALTKEAAKWQAFKIEDAKKNDIFDAIDESIDSDFISNTEEYVVDNLRKKFSGSGFIFEESGMGNYLTVKFIPHDGNIETLELGESKQIEIPLNYGDRSGLNDINAKKLKDFMKGAYMTNSEWKNFSPTEEELKNGRGDALNHLTWMLKSTELMAKNPSKYGKELIGDDQVENVLNRASFAIKKEYKSLELEYDDLKKRIDIYNQNPTDAERIAINNKLHELSVKEYNTNEKANKISQVDNNWNKITGAYALEQSKKGNFLGNIASSYLGGRLLKSTEKMILGLSMDAGVNLMDAENLIDASTYQMYKDGGLSDDDIKEKVLAEAKRYFMPRIDEAYTRITSLGSTTEEYKKSTDRGVFENVISGLAESIGTAQSGKLSTLGFFATSYDSLQSQMLGKEFDGMTQSEKMLFSVPFGLVVGALEKFGYDASVGFSKSGIFNKTVNTVIRKSLTDLPKDATIGEINREINKNVATLVKSGVIKIAAGSITEGNVEGIQGLTETGTKFIVNELYDKELFQNVPDLSTQDGLIEAIGMASEDAALGALGGLIMSGGSISTQTYKQAKFNETSDYKFDHFYGTLMDDKLRRALKYNTKIKLKNGEITESEAKEELESIDRNTGILRSIPTELSLRDKKDSFNLIVERNRLEQEIDGKDAALIVKQKARISEINGELNKISENATKENNVEQQEDTTEGSKVEYQGAVKGQQEVGTTEGTVGQTTQQKTDTGDSTVASEEAKVVIDKPTISTNTANEVDRVKSLDINSEDGATLNLDGSKYEGAGLVVPVDSINTTIEELTPEMIADFVEERQDMIGDEGVVKAGIYKFPNSNQVSIDLSVVVPETSREQAIEFGRLADQESLFDLGTFENVKTGGTGKNPMKFTPEQHREIAKALKEGRVPNVFGSVIEQATPVETELEAREKDLGEKLKAKYSELESQGMTFEEIKKNPEYKAISDEWYKAYSELQKQTGETKTEKAVAEQEVVAEVKPTAKTVEQEVEEIGQLVEGSDIEIDRIANTIPDKKMAKVVARAAKAISRIAPGVKFKIHATDAEYRLAVDESTEGASSNGTFDPATNTVHINLENANNRTVAHEVFHAILLNKVRTNKDAAAVTKKMIEAISSKLDGMPDLKKYLDDFASNYEENIQSEEKLSELVGILAENYMNAPTSVKDVIYRWIDRLAKMFGLDPFQRNEVYDMLNTIARKTAKGKVIKESDIKVIPSITDKNGNLKPPSKKSVENLKNRKQNIVNETKANVSEGNIVSTRLPKSNDVHSNNEYVVSISDLEKIASKDAGAEAQYIKIAKEISGYNISKIKNVENIKDAKKVISEFKESVKLNLKWLHDSFGNDVRDISKLWYDGANKICNNISSKYNYSLEQVSGVMAVLSPQMDWFRNLSLGERVIDIYSKQQDSVFDDKMINYVNTATSGTGKNKVPLFKEAKDIVSRVKGKKLSELNKKDKAYFIRVFDEVYNPREYNNISPNGEVNGLVRKSDGTPGACGWGAFPTIEKSISILQDGSIENISSNLGNMHKVRNFFNNISNPNDINAVTIDTHAVAAALLLPLSGSSTQVLYNFGGAGNVNTGMNGTYPVYADAYRELAKELNLLPREVQSITWEAVRGLFKATFKSNKSNEANVNKIWDDYSSGLLSLDEAHSRIESIAGGISKPVWYEYMADDNVKSLDKNSAGLDQANLDNEEETKVSSRKQIIGKNAKLSKNVRDNLNVARDMESVGKSSKDIRIATGWERGADNKWRYEIPDNIPLLKDAVKSIDGLLYKDNNVSVKGDKFLPKELLDVYPELNDINFEFTNDILDSYYSPDTNTIKILNRLSSENTVSSVVHEIQHVIQEIEGFAGGGNLRSSARLAISFLEKKLGKKIEKTTRDEIVALDLKGAEENFRTFILKTFYAARTQKQLLKLIDKKAYDVYKKLAGEAESRNVEARMNMTPEERRQTTLQQTEDVSREDQIIFFKETETTKRKQKPVAGNKLFNEPLKDASTIADRYAKKSGITMQEVIPVTSLDKENSKAISDEFEKMKDDPTNPEVAAAYNKMVDETISQYEEIVKDGYFVEINNEEPYSSSEDMIKDLKENKRFKVFSTESGFGSEGISDKQRSENPLLKDSGFKDVNGETLLVNDVFRFVHDFFGHAKFGNSFGPIGEENAWMIHSVMYSPLARRAMTSETRGQNSYVNFSGVNEEAFRLRDKARALRQEGKIEQANKLVEKVYDIMKFADQKVGLMPEWVSGTGNIDGAIKIRKQKPSNINAVIKLCKENGFSNEGITKYLEGKGFSDEQINNSLAPYIAKENAKNDFNIEYSRLIDEGATEENAFNEAMDNVVYKMDDDILREEVARELMKSYGKKIKSAPRVEKIIGKAKPITITTNDVKGLNDIIKREAKAAKDKKKQVDEVIATIAAQVKDLVTKGSISIRQMSAIINALKNTNFDNQVMVDRFMDYVLKVVSNADYIERVNKGLNFKKAIKRNLKGRANPFVSVAKSFTELNPKWVVDINKYNEIAELVFNSVKPTRITKDTVNFKKEADIETIAKYIAEEQENHLKIHEANVRDRYERITGKESKGKTIEEMNTILVNLKGDKKNYSSQIATELKEKLAEYKKMVTNEDLAEVKAAVNVDLNLIDTKMAISILDALDTYFANGSNASLKAIMATYDGIVAVNNFNGKAKALRMLGSKKIGRVQNEQFTNINMMFKRLFRGQNAGQAFSEAIGFNNLVQGSNRAERQSVDKQNEYTNRFKKVKNFNSAENIFERNVIAWLRRRDVNANEQDSFNKRLKLLKDSVDVLRKSGTATEIAKADVYEKVFKKLGLYNDNVNIKDVLAKSEKFNIDAVDFVTEMWSDIYNQLSDTALGVYNTMLANDINYTPDKFTNLDSSTPSKFDVESSGFMSFNSNYTLDKNSAGVLMETTRPSELPDNMYIDLDFDRNMFRSYKLALNDMYTAEAIRHTNAFLKSDKFKEIIPTAEDRRIVMTAIQGYVSAKKGKNYIERSEMNFLNSFLDAVGGFGAVRALAGFSQFINQWSTANVNTMINAGEYMRPGDLFNKDIANMIANSGLPISNVGIEALTTIENADKELEKAGIVATVGGAVDKYTLNYLKKWNALLLKQLLANPDRFARVQAFAAYYRKSMKAQGLEVDFKAPMNDKAAKYAQSMIDANMDVSDTEMRGKFFKNKEAYVKIIKQVFFPFATFSMNQRNRVWSDAAVVVNAANNQERAMAFRSLVAFSAEFFAYNGIRYGVGLLIIKAAVAALGLDDDEEEKIIKKYEDNLIKSIKSSAITDIVSPTPVLDEVTLSVMNQMMPMFGIGTPTEEEFQKYIDEINEERIYKGKEKLTEDEVALKRNKFMLDEQFQFYIDNEKSTGMLGIQLTKIKELYEIVDAYYTGKYSRERFAGGGYEEVNLSDDAKESLKYIALLKLEGTILGPRESDQIANRMFKIVKDTKTLTEVQKAKYDVIKKDYEIDPYKMSLIKTSMKTENIIEEIEYIESTGGLTEKQSKEYAKLRAFGAIDGWGLDDLRKGKTASEIIAEKTASQ